MDPVQDDASPSSIGDDTDNRVSGLKKKQRAELEKLTLTNQPLKTIHLFFVATLPYLKKSLLLWLTIPIFLILSLGIMYFLIDDPHSKIAWELFHYFSFGLWWISLGVASSIGLGYGYHTFVLYLGPHIALFTSKVMKCGRVDLKFAPYDTILLNGRPSWLNKECRDFGPPEFPLVSGSLVRVPLGKILPQIQLEALLWGLGTALGELPPYFISRAAHNSGNMTDVELNADLSTDSGILSSFVNRIKRWLFSHSRHLNFATILMLASIPNPLYDVAGILCGHSGIPFWKFFLATLTGKALIKTHLQMVFVILMWNNQLLDFVERKLVWMLGGIPGFSHHLPRIISKLHSFIQKYQTTQSTDDHEPKVQSWRPSISLIWNSVIWLVFMNFIGRIVTSTARKQLKEHHKMELAKISSSFNTAESD